MYIPSEPGEQGTKSSWAAAFCVQVGDPGPSKSQETILVLETRLSFRAVFILAYPLLTAVGVSLIYAVVSGIRLSSLLALGCKVCLQKPCCLCGELYPRSQILY